MIDFAVANPQKRPTPTAFLHEVFKTSLRATLGETAVGSCGSVGWRGAAARLLLRVARSRPHLEHFVASSLGCADRAELAALPTGSGAHRLWSPRVDSRIPLKRRHVARACEQTWGQIGVRDAA